MRSPESLAEAGEVNGLHTPVQYSALPTVAAAAHNSDPCDRPNPLRYVSVEPLLVLKLK